MAAQTWRPISLVYSLCLGRGTAVVSSPVIFFSVWMRFLLSEGFVDVTLGSIVPFILPYVAIVVVVFAWLGGW